MFVTAAHLYPDIESCAKAYDRVIGRFGNASNKYFPWLLGSCDMFMVGSVLSMYLCYIVYRAKHLYVGLL